MNLKDYLIFFRTPNLLMIIFIQLILKYVLFQKFNLTTTLDDFHFSILVASTVLIALAGYIINDINDIKTDLINKPTKVFVSKKLSHKNADTLFLVFNFLGLLAGYYLSYSINKVSFFAIFIIASLLSYLYSIKLKKYVLLKNLIVSFLVFLSVFIVGLYDIVPATSNYNNQDQWNVFNLVLKISVFAFLLTFLREIIKDLMDIEGDKKNNMRTLPIVIGIGKTKALIIITGIITLIAVAYFAISLYSTNQYVTYYLIGLVLIPLIYFILIISNTYTKKEFAKLSNLLKIIMLLGMFFVFLY